MGHIARKNVDAMVLEIADGIFQQETSALLQSQVFASLVSGILMASQDSMGASAGIDFLRKHAKPPVVAISGIISAAPLQIREAVTALHLPVYNREELATPENAIKILADTQHSQILGATTARHIPATSQEEAMTTTPESAMNISAPGTQLHTGTKNILGFLPKIKQMMQQFDSSKKYDQ